MITQQGLLYSKQTIYLVAGISRQGFMQQKAKQQKHDEMNITLREKVKAVRMHHPQMGSRSLYHAASITEMGISKFERWMSLQGLTIIKKRNGSSPRKVVLANDTPISHMD